MKYPDSTHPSKFHPLSVRSSLLLVTQQSTGSTPHNANQKKNDSKIEPFNHKNMLIETFNTSAGFEPGSPVFQNQHHTDRDKGRNSQFIFRKNATFLTLTTFLTSIFFNCIFSGIFGRVRLFYRALSERPKKLRATEQTDINWFTLFLYNYFFLLTVVV